MEYIHDEPDEPLDCDKSTGNDVTQDDELTVSSGAGTRPAKRQMSRADQLLVSGAKQILHTSQGYHEFSWSYALLPGGISAAVAGVGVGLAIESDLNIADFGIAAMVLAGVAGFIGTIRYGRKAMIVQALHRSTPQTPIDSVPPTE